VPGGLEEKFQSAEAMNAVIGGKRTMRRVPLRFLPIKTAAD